MVQEAKKYEDESFEVITEKLDALKERAEIVAVPETLDYLLAGGRLSKAGWMAGKLLSICPIIGFEDGKVVSIEKKRGKQQAINYMVKKVETDGVDPEYGLIAAYSYTKANIDEVLGQTSPEITKYLVTYDHISPTIGSHFGPNAFGYYYIKK